MKILHVIPFFTPALGGSVAVAYYLSHWLAKEGHEVTIITTDYMYDPGYAQSLENVEVIPFKNFFNIGLFIYSPELKTWLKQNLEKFDIIHMHGYRSYQNTIVSQHAAKCKKPYALQPHGSLPIIGSQRVLKWFYDKVWGDEVIQNASRVVVLNEMEKQYAEKWNLDVSRIETIPNGITREEFEILPPKGMFKQKIGLDADTKVLLFLGRINRIKGLSLLLEAFSEIFLEDEKTYLVIAGPDDGDLSSVMKQIEQLGIDKRVVVTGPLYKEEKNEAYCDADVYVLPSIYEVFPVTILEAGACGAAIITTSRCGIADFVKEIGTVVDYDKMQLKRAIELYLLNPDISKKNGIAARKKIMREFTWDIVIERFNVMYQSMGGGTP
jgi:glycosyltransferase involved in cell wall biosynthesis